MGCIKQINEEINSETKLQILCKSLGWQGGTIHQVAEEISKVVNHIDGTYTVQELLDLNLDNTKRLATQVRMVLAGEL